MPSSSLGMYTEQDFSRGTEEGGTAPGRRRDRVYGQLLQMADGTVRFLHPFEGLACMGWPIIHLPVKAWSAIGNTITLPQAGLALGLLLEIISKITGLRTVKARNYNAFYLGEEPVLAHIHGT